MDDMFTPSEFDDAAGLERMNYTRFDLLYHTRRPTQAPVKFDTLSQMQLPTGAMLHTLSGMDTLAVTHEGLPDPENPLVLNEKLPVWLKINTVLSGPTSHPLGVKDTFIYRPNKVLPFVSHFYQKHRRYHPIRAERTIGTMTGVLTWMDYSPMTHLVVNGTLHAYRKFDIIFRTILNKIAEVGPAKHHYIVLPQSDAVYGRSVLQRTFKELSTNTLGMFLDDPSIFPMLHLLGFVFGKGTPLTVKPYKEDVQLLGKDAALFDTVASTSLFERLDPSLLASINLILTRNDQAVVYNLGDVLRFSEDKSFYTKLYRHVMNLRLKGSGMTDVIDVDSDQFDTLIDTVAKPSPEDAAKTAEPVVVPTSTKPQPTSPIASPRSIQTPPVTAPVTHVEDMRIETVKPKGFEEAVRKAASARIVASEHTTDKPLVKHADLIDRHFQAQIQGTSLGELIQAPVTDKIIAPPMTFVTSAPEPSYQNTSLLAMDKAYQKTYHHELAKVVGSMAKHGLYITKSEETKVHTEMDKTTTYKFHLSDETGKSHHVKFTLPDVDANGNMKLGGIEYRLTRQIANVPICKISQFRVNLSSYYNKAIIERVQAKRFSYEEAMTKHLLALKAQGLIRAVTGVAPYPTIPVAYDYTAIGRRFTELQIRDYLFYFGGNYAPRSELNFDTQEAIREIGTTYGQCVGVTEPGDLLYWDMGNQIHQVSKTKTLIQSWPSFGHLLVDLLGTDGLLAKTPAEWTQANILNQTIPLVFILGYKLGLKSLLDLIRLDYVFYPTGTKAKPGIMDYAVKFNDGVLVFNRYPLPKSLLAAGLLWVDLKDVAFQELQIPDTYYRVFAKKDMGPGVFKGLNGFFDFFVDPITEQVLEKMHEPTTFPELLLRANVMLSDYHAKDASSIELHRFRLYERFNGTVYKEIYRALANYRGNPNSKKAFSINPEAVFQKIVQDATVSLNDVINPVHEVKQRANFTFTGADGRMGRAIVLKDRVYPKDGLGVVSDAVPDSGKVGITSYLSAAPRIDDIHGLPIPYKDGDPLEPTQILSIGSMIMPGGTTDDGKRNAYLSIQISHYVPNQGEGETMAVRTGYDEVLPHLSTDTFAIPALGDGTVTHIDSKHQVLTVQYNPTPTPVTGTLKTPYIDAVLAHALREKGTLAILVPDTEIGAYPVGSIFQLNPKTHGKVLDRLRYEDPADIPDKEVIRKYHNLLADFAKGKYTALYYVRLQIQGTTTPGKIQSHSYKDVHSPLSGAYILQTRVPNVQVGEPFKTGDILVYNPGFYVPDPMSKQVTFKHGVLANVALIDKASNHEDSCEITQALAKRLLMTPCHQREIVTKSSAAILAMVKVGDHVETADSLCVISDDYLATDTVELNVDNLDIMEKLSRQTPPADYAGRIKTIRILYSGQRADLSPSLQKILKVYEKDVLDAHKALLSDHLQPLPDKPGWVAPGTKYKGITFTEDTVVLEFMIAETIGMAEGDKAVIGNQLKTVVSLVSEEQHYTESGLPVDMLFSATSVLARIVNSPFYGLAERIMDKLKDDVLDLYFDKP